MNDRYQKIRDALAMGPTPGPWKWWEHEDCGDCRVNPRDGGLLIAKCDVRNPFDPEQRANAALIAACDPDTIRELLEERDALRKALKELIAWVPSADTYRRLGFDPVAPMQAYGAAKAILKKGEQSMTDTTNINELAGQSEKQRATLSLVELDLRDFFAAKALQGLLANNFNIDCVVERAWCIADAMIKARESHND